MVAIRKKENDNFMTLQMQLFPDITLTEKSSGEDQRIDSIEKFLTDK